MFKRLLLCAGVTFVLALAVLLALGPVWIHDVEDCLLGVLGAFFALFFLMALLAGAAPDVAADIAAEAVGNAVGAAAEVAGHGVPLLGRLARGAGPAGGGLLLGGFAALFTMWILAHWSPLRMSYARARPERALAADFLKVGELIDRHKKAKGRPPEDAAALGRALREEGVELRYSTLQNGVWTDPWDRPFFYEAGKKLLGWKVRAYSYGPDGKDDGGEPDDLGLDRTLGLLNLLRIVNPSAD